MVDHAFRSCSRIFFLVVKRFLIFPILYDSIFSSMKKKIVWSLLIKYIFPNIDIVQNGFTTFMYSKNSKTSDPLRLIFNVSGKIDLKRCYKYVSWLNIDVYYTWLKFKKKTHIKHWNENISPTYNSHVILYQIFKIMLSIL